VKITVPANVIKALLLAASKQDVRYYLNAVCVDVTAKGAALVATDGHVLLAVPVENPVEDPVDGQWIIDRDVLTSVKPLKAGRTEFPITSTIDAAPVRPDPDRPGVTITGTPAITIAGATTATTAPVDARYPDWRRVIPASQNNIPSQFDAALVATFGKIYDSLCGGKGSPRIHHNGASGAFVDGLGANAIGVIMPMRDGPDETPIEHPGIPDWV
jgi:hypothetical protein